MKKLLLIVLAISLIGLVGCKKEAVAGDDTNPITITAKQGFVIPWKSGVVKNLTTFETVRTKPVDSWGRWNMLTDGWSLDAGFAYDATSINTGAVLLGRKFGTLGKYLPFLDFPLMNKIDITLYPVGLYINNLTDHPTFKGCSGGGIIRAEIKFG